MAPEASTSACVTPPNALLSSSLHLELRAFTEALVRVVDLKFSRNPSATRASSRIDGFSKALVVMSQISSLSSFASHADPLWLVGDEFVLFVDFLVASFSRSSSAFRLVST